MPLVVKSIAACCCQTTNGAYASLQRTSLRCEFRRRCLQHASAWWYSIATRGTPYARWAASQGPLLLTPRVNATEILSCGERSIGRWRIAHGPPADHQLRLPPQVLLARVHVACMSGCVSVTLSTATWMQPQLSPLAAEPQGGIAAMISFEPC